MERRKPTREQQTLAATHYNSVAGMMEAMRMAANTAGKSDNRVLIDRYLNRTGNENWYGTGIYGTADVFKALQHGYPHGEKIVTGLLSQLSAKLPRALGHNRVIVRGDAGDSLDIHAVNKGNVDKAWVSAQRRVRSGTGIIRIAVDICGNGDQSAQSLGWRGVTAITLCQIMEKAGYSVEIVAAMATSRSSVDEDVDTLTTVTVKPRNTRVDIGFLSAVLTMSGFFRSVGFAAVVANVDKVGKNCISGLGKYMQAANVLPVQSKVMQLTVDGSVNSESECIDYVRNAIMLLQHSTMSKEGKR